MLIHQLECSVQENNGNLDWDDSGQDEMNTAANTWEAGSEEC